jgi:hypothetical protein
LFRQFDEHLKVFFPSCGTTLFPIELEHVTDIFNGEKLIVLDNSSSTDRLPFRLP